MLLLALPVCSLSVRMNADLSPPFYPSDNGRIGYWEFSGAAQVNHNSIMLVPPIQFRKGGAWTNVEVPSGDWSINLQFQITSSDAGGGFGLWIIDKYGANGPLNGGPDHFCGLAILANVINSNSIQLRVLQSSSPVVDQTSNLPDSVATVNFTENEPFTITAQFSGASLILLLRGAEVHRVSVQENLAKLFIGVTAATDQRVARFDLISASFDLDTGGFAEELRKHEKQMQTNDAHYSPNRNLLLRQPAFNLTVTELQNRDFTRGTRPEATISHLFDIIEELGTAVNGVASYSELSAFIRETLVPYTEKWQRRTMRMVDRVREARDVAGAASNYTRDMVNAFKAELGAEAIRTTEKIYNLESILSDIARGGVDETGELGQLVLGVNKSRVMQFVFFVSAAEFVVLVCFLLFAHTPCAAKLLL